jgi:16S rRNA (guanine527-N7)-methyltransferase
MAAFQQRLLTVKQHTNLTAITDGEAIAVKHFIDSLSLLPWLAEGARVLDVGAGAGFPGLAVKIARPDLNMTLLDSLRKRVFFLQDTIDALGLTGARCLHANAKELVRRAEHAHGYDIVTARAVARLDRLVPYTLPFVKKGGLLLAMKGPNVSDELLQAQPHLKKHGGRVAEVRAVDISEDITHTVVVIVKV